MVDLAGKSVTIVGRLGALPNRVAAARLSRLGGRLGRSLSSDTAYLVIGRKSHAQLAGGRLQARLARADELGVACLSEGAFLEALELLPSPPESARTLSLEALPDQAGLAPEVVRLLALFDVVQPRAGGCSFRDLVAAREVARLLADGIELSAILASAERIGGAGAGGVDQPLTRLKLVADRDGRLGRRIDGGFAELDGQLRLALPGADNPSPDELFEAAEEAEQAGDLALAASLYRRCADLDRRDPIAPFNLANVLREQGAPREARLFLQRALAADPGFADAWFNLAILLEAEGDRAGAAHGLRRAIALDPDYADPLYNLAQLQFEAGEFAEARELWHRYLRLDPDSEWSRRARHGLALCRQDQGMG